MRRNRAMLFALLAVGGVILVIVLVAVALAPGSTAACPNGPCASPPPGGGSGGGSGGSPGGPQGFPLTLGNVYTSSAFGFSVRYRDGFDVEEGDAFLSLYDGNSDTLCKIEAGEASSISPDQALDSGRASLQKSFPTLAEDSSPAFEVLGPNIGYVDGVGQSYAGSFQSPQGVQGEIHAYQMAATDGRITVLATGITSQPAESVHDAVAQCDSVLNTFGWSG
jgi:hypothetical protein